MYYSILLAVGIYNVIEQDNKTRHSTIVMRHNLLSDNFSPDLFLVLDHENESHGNTGLYSNLPCNTGLCQVTNLGTCIILLLCRTCDKTHMVIFSAKSSIATFNPICRHVMPCSRKRTKIR